MRGEHPIAVRNNDDRLYSVAAARLARSETDPDHAGRPFADVAGLDYFDAMVAAEAVDSVCDAELFE